MIVPSADPRGLRMAANQAAFRKKLGPGVFEYPAGVLRDATCKTLGMSDAGALVAEGVGNAAFADALRITVNADPPITRKAEGSACLYLGQGFTITKVPPAEVAFGAGVAQPLIVFRTPAPSAATTETIQEAGAAGQPQNAGKRKEY